MLQKVLQLIEEELMFSKDIARLLRKDIARKGIYMSIFSW